MTSCLPWHWQGLSKNGLPIILLMELLMKATTFKHGKKSNTLGLKALCGRAIIFKEVQNVLFIFIERKRKETRDLVFEHSIILENRFIIRLSFNVFFCSCHLHLRVHRDPFRPNTHRMLPFM